VHPGAGHSDEPPEDMQSLRQTTPIPAHRMDSPQPMDPEPPIDNIPDDYNPDNEDYDPENDYDFYQ
jgi:hypothetical protein